MTVQLSERHTNFLILIILILYPVVGMSVDLIAPALPAISTNLNISPGTVKNLITIYLLGYASGNLIIGSLADGLGRKKLFLGGWVLFAIVSYLPVLFPNILLLDIARYLQGISLAAVGVIARAIFSDILTPEKLKMKASWIATSWGIGPIIGPVIGGYLQYYINWQACFIFFSIYGAIGFFSFVFLLPETHHQRIPLSFFNIKKNFTEIVTHRLFIGTVIMMGASYALLIVFNTLGPFLIQNVLGKTPVYFGHTALCMGLAFLFGTILCRYLLTYTSSENIALYSTIITLIVCILMVLFSFLFPKNVWLIIIPSAIAFLCTGIIFPAVMGKCQVLFRHIAGSISALMQFSNVFFAAIVSWIMSLFFAHSAFLLAISYCALLVTCLIGYFGFIHQREKK